MKTNVMCYIEKYTIWSSCMVVFMNISCDSEKHIFISKLAHPLLSWTSFVGAST